MAVDRVAVQVQRDVGCADEPGVLAAHEIGMERRVGGDGVAAAQRSTAPMGRSARGSKYRDRGDACERADDNSAAEA